MNVFQTLLASEVQHLRGLYSYWASSVGDAVLLPAIVGGLYCARTSLPSVRGGSAVGAALGAITGIASGFNQFSWLQDPGPDLNWTLIAPHTFNVAGWYHAAFSVALAGYCGYQVGDLMMRVRKHGVTRSTKAATLVVLGAAGAFAVLLIIDNLPNLDRAASRSSMAALAGAGMTLAAVAAFVASRKPAPEVEWPCVPEVRNTGDNGAPKDADEAR